MFKKQILSYLSNPFVRIIYNIIFVIPCLFIDLVNKIYYEFKTSPKAAYIIFALELLIIASIFIIPIITKWKYLNISDDKTQNWKIDAEINEIKMKKKN